MRFERHLWNTPFSWPEHVAGPGHPEPQDDLERQFFVLRGGERVA